MSANRSSAVMAQRTEPRDSLDDFPTPPWATRALVERLVAGTVGPLLGAATCWEPACNRGHMARPLAESFARVRATDVHDYGWPGQEAVEDFLMPVRVTARPDWVITNPPFRLAAEFVARALDIADGVAIFIRTAFLEGQERHDTLFSRTPPGLILQFAERVVLHRGVLRDPERPYIDLATGEVRTPSSATAYCWLVWMPGDPPRPDTRFGWIAPCRRRLTRPGDYPPASAEVAA